MLVQRSLYNIFHILRYLGKLNASEWGERLPEHFREEVAPPCCWACTEYSPSQIPAEYLPAYLRSDAYLEFCWSVELYLEPEETPSKGPVDSVTGKFKPEVGDFIMYGFCKRKKTLVWATDKYDCFTPRKLAPPIGVVSISMGGRQSKWWVLAKLDSQMGQQLGEWIEWINCDYKFGEPSDTAKHIFRLLKGAALSIETVESWDSGYDFSIEQLIERDEGGNVFPIIKFPTFLWLIKLEHPPEGLGGRQLCYRELNGILHAAILYERGAYWHEQPPIKSEAKNASFPFIFSF